MRIMYRVLAVLLSISTLVYASGNSWDRVRYNGGTLQTKVDRDDWGNHLTITSDKITFKLKDGQTVEIPTRNVTALSYGQEAHRRVGTMIALAILVAPVALFGLFHKTRLHYIGIEYTTSDSKNAGLLLQGDKNNYRAILMALKGATGAPLSVADEDRKYVPTGISASVVPASQKERIATLDREEAGTATVNSARVQSPIAANAALKLLGISAESNPIYGLRVLSVTPDSPAARAGFAANDYIVKVNGRPVKTADELSTALFNGSERATVIVNRPEWSSSQTVSREVLLK